MLIFWYDIPFFSYGISLIFLKEDNLLWWVLAVLEICLLLFFFICKLPSLDNFLHLSFMYLWNQMDWSGVLGKIWKGFDFWKDSYVVHVPLKWYRGGESVSALQGLTQLWKDFVTSSPISSFPPPEYTPIYHPVFSSFVTGSRQFCISLKLTDLP